MKTASFVTDTDRAEKRFKKFEAEAKKSALAVTATLTAMATATVYALKTQIDAMDEASKNAQKVGVSTQAWTELAYAASLADVSSDQLKTSMVKLSREVADGGDALAAMGVSITDASGKIKTADQLLFDIADKFAGYDDGIKKSALASELFGKGLGAEMIPLLNGGAEGLREASAEARALGVAFGDAAGKEAEQFNDDLTRLKAGVSGLFISLAKDMLPTLQELVDDLKTTSGESSNFRVALEGVTSAIVAVVKAAKWGADAVSDLGENLGANAASMKFFLSGEFEKAFAVGDELQKNRAAREDNSLTKSIGNWANWGRSVQESLKSVTSAGKTEAPTILGAEAKKDLEKQAADLKKALRTPLEIMEDEQSNAKKLFESGVLDPESFARATKKAEDAYKSAMAGATKSIKTAKTDAQRELESLMKEGERLAESLASPSEKLGKEREKYAKLESIGAISPEIRLRADTSATKEYEDALKQQRQALDVGLKTEEQMVTESYNERIATIKALTLVGESEKNAAIFQLTTQHEENLQKLRDSQYESLVSGLRTEEEEIQASYDRRMQAILDATELTETQQTDLIARLQADRAEKLKKIEDDAQKKRMESQAAILSSYGSMFGGMADIIKTYAGEESTAYKAMFAVSKAFAIAESIIKLNLAIANAAASGPFPANLAAMASVASAVGGVISSISGASFGGTRADGGYVSAGREYLVGERGPERFVPNQPGNIIPTDAMTGGGQAPINLRIVNAYSDDHIDNYLGSDAAERKIMNVNKRNSDQLKAIVS